MGALPRLHHPGLHFYSAIISVLESALQISVQSIDRFDLFGYFGLHHPYQSRFARQLDR